MCAPDEDDMVYVCYVVSTYHILLYKRRMVRNDFQFKHDHMATPVTI